MVQSSPVSLLNVVCDPLPHFPPASTASHRRSCRNLETGAHRSINMARSLIFAAALLCFVACASAQCIECSQCTPGNSYCLKNCKRECEKGYNANACQGAGKRAGYTEGSNACKTLIAFCSQMPSRSSGRNYGGGWNIVNLQQCQNIFYGGCQSEGLNAARASGCYFIGTTPGRTQAYKLCDATTVNEFFNGELNARCNKAANYYKP